MRFYGLKCYFQIIFKFQFILNFVGEYEGTKFLNLQFIR